MITISKKLLVIILSIAVVIAMSLIPTSAKAYAATSSSKTVSAYGGHDGGGFGPSGPSFGGQWGDRDEDTDEDVDEDMDGDEDENSGEVSISEDPEDATYAIGNFADDLFVELDGDDTDVTYQWYSNTTDSTDSGTAIAGATDAELDGDSISTAAAGVTYYYCVVSTADGEELISDAAEITVKALAITTQPGGGTYKIGKSVKLKVKFVGNGDVQWYKSTDGETWTEIEGADGCSYKASLRTEGTTYYKAVVTNGLDSEETGYASVTSSTAKIVVSGTSSAATKIGKLKYKISGEGTVTVVGASKRTYTSLTIPATVTISGTQYSVTAINSHAFSGSFKLRKVTFEGTGITSIGSDAFRGVYHKVKFYIPTEQLESYQTLIENADAPGGASYIAI